MTDKQVARQKARVNGQYAEMQKCYVCKAFVGDDYWSHPDTDQTINDELLCLCKKCCDKLSKYSGTEAIKIAFKGGN